MNRQKIESNEEKENTNLEFLAKEGQLKDKGEPLTNMLFCSYLSMVQTENWYIINLPAIIWISCRRAFISAQMILPSLCSV